jgi:hypothetical protein
MPIEASYHLTLLKIAFVKKKKNSKDNALAMIWKKENPCALFMGMKLV